MGSQKSTKSASETKKFAADFAKKVFQTVPSLEGALVIGLEGNLGSGKTTFTQGFAKGLEIKEKILSPTFVIFKKYKIQDTKYKIRAFYHVDCYRLKKPQELLELGFKEIIGDPKNIVVIEWVERVKKILPKNSIQIKFIATGKNQRLIKLK